MDSACKALVIDNLLCGNYFGELHADASIHETVWGTRRGSGLRRLLRDQIVPALGKTVLRILCNTYPAELTDELIPAVGSWLSAWPNSTEAVGIKPEDYYE
jgi:hypothetical protein